MVAQYDQFKSGRERTLFSSSTSTDGMEINKYDRSSMINAFRRIHRENPLYAGMVNTIACNVVGPHGSRPMPNTGNKELDKRLLDYFMSWAESPELRGLCSYWEYQRILLSTMINEGGCGTVLTNIGKIQGIEEDRIQTPQEFSSLENYSIFQGVQVNPNTGAPERYWVLSRSKNGWGWNQDSKVGVPAKDFIYTYKCDRFSQYRGVPTFFPSYDWLNDLEEICDFVKFAFKVQSVFAVFIKGDGSAPGDKPSLSGLKNDDKSTEAGKVVIDLDKGKLIDGRKIGADDVKTISATAAGPQFESFAKFLSGMIGLPAGIPVDFVLLKLHDGNYSSQRLALRVTYKAFMMLWQILNSFNQRVYRWKVYSGIKLGKIQVPDNAQGTFLKCNWSMPIPESADPEKENKAAADAIAYGLSSPDSECLSRGFYWEDVAERNKKGIEYYLSNSIPWIIGTSPGIRTIQDMNASNDRDHALAEKYRRE
jgi:capsid protein